MKKRVVLLLLGPCTFSAQAELTLKEVRTASKKREPHPRPDALS